MRALAIPGRLELPTYGLGNRRSIRLSYGTTACAISRRLMPSYQTIPHFASRSDTSGTLDRDPGCLEPAGLIG